MRQTGELASVVRFGSFELNPQAGELRRRGIRVKLQDQPLHILLLLLEHSGGVVTREEIQKRLWPPGTFVDYDNAINTAVRKLREALGDTADNPRFIETLARRGYRFTGQINAEPSGKPYDSPLAVQPAPTNPVQAEHLPIASENLRTPAKARRYSRRALSGVAAMLLISGLLAFLLFRREAAPHRELELKQLTTNDAENFVGNSVISPDARYLLYGDQIGIHLRVIATGDIHTFDRPRELSPDAAWYPTSWFPDQERFLAASERLTANGLIPTTWVVNLLDGRASRLQDRAMPQSVSPDGSRIAFTTGGVDSNQQVWTMGPRGEDPKRVASGDRLDRLMASGDEPGTFPIVQWSPDGRRLFDLRTRWVGGSDDSSRVQYTVESRPSQGGPALEVVSYATASDFPDWRGSGVFCVLHDGRVIYTRSESAESFAGNDATNLWEIRVAPATGKPQGPSRPITNWFHDHVDRLSVSRDEKTMSLQKSTWRLHAYIGDFNSEGGLQPSRRLTLDESDDLPYSWMPDSTAVIFASNRTGAYRIYKQALDRKMAEPVTTGPDVNDEASVSPDDRWIVYTAGAMKGSRPRLMRVPLSGGAPQLIAEASVTPQVKCPRPPATRCFALDEGKAHLFRSFDPVTGDTRDLFSLPFWNGGWTVTPDGRIAILRQDTNGSRVQLLSESGRVEQEIGLAPWSNFAGLDWSADRNILYTAAVGPSGATVLRVSASGRIEPLCVLRGSKVAWAIPSPDGRHLALLGKTSYSNAWLLNNF